MKYISALEEFITYLRLHRNASPKTIEQYELHIWKFLEFVDPKTTGHPDLDLPHHAIFVETSEDPEKRAKKMQTKMFLRGLCRLEIENVNLEDLNEFRLFLADK